MSWRLFVSAPADAVEAQVQVLEGCLNGGGQIAPEKPVEEDGVRALSLTAPPRISDRIPTRKLLAKSCEGHVHVLCRASLHLRLASPWLE